MNFFQKAIEYNKLAKAFNGCYLMLQPLIDKALYSNIREDLFTLAYFARIDIIDRMEKINYKMTTRIVVPMMPGNNKTLEYAYFQTISNIISLARINGYSDEIKDILDKGELFYEMENNIPNNIKSKMRL